MIYLLLAALVLLTLVSYGLCGRDFFAPGTMLCLAFVFSCASALYNASYWQLDLAPRTVGVIVSALSITVGVNIWAHGCFQRVRVQPWSGRATPIPVWVSAGLLAALGVVLVVMLAQIRRIGGGGSFASAMVIFRAKNAYGVDLADQLPGWVRQMLNASAVIAFLYLFHLIWFGRRLGRLHLALNAAVLAACVTVSLLTGGRFSAMTMVVAGAVLWYMLRSGGPRGVRLKTLFWVMMAALAVLYGFYAVKALVGRQSDQTVVEYITHYAGGGIPGLDLYLKDPPAPSGIWGKETFYALNNGLRKLGLLDIPYYYIHHEFRQSGGVSVGNIYTALRDYHYDFGMVGMYLLHTVFSVAFCFYYEYQKKRRSHLGILVWAMVYYCVVFYPISNSFFASVVSFGFGIRLGLLVFLYLLLIRKKGDAPCRNPL